MSHWVKYPDSKVIRVLCNFHANLWDKCDEFPKTTEIPTKKAKDVSSEDCKVPGNGGLGDSP